MSTTLTSAGFCAVSKTFHLPGILQTEAATSTIKANGLRAEFGEKIFCVAAEPHATFLRISVFDVTYEAAYATCVLGRLKRGYRVLQMRSKFGTRIELCYLFVRVQIGSMRNLWPSARQVRDATASRHTTSQRSPAPSCSLYCVHTLVL